MKISWIKVLSLVLLVAHGAMQRFHHKEDFFTSYRTFGEIGRYMRYMAAADSGAKVTLLRTGTSFEGRPIRCLRIEGTRTDNEITRGLLLTAGVHGREWNTISSVLYVISKLLDAYGDHAQITELINHVSIHAFPVVNPDGYVHTWSPFESFNGPNGFSNYKFIQHFRLRKGTHVKSSKSSSSFKAPSSRFWRPNRRYLGKMQGDTLYGVDLNRNWGTLGVNWGLGVSNPKSPNFQGKEGFSEPETKAVRFYAYRRQDISGFLDIHCCSRNIIAPFSLKPYDTEIAEEFAKAGRFLVNAMTTVLRKSDPKAKYMYEFRPKSRKKYSSGISSGWGWVEMGWNNSFTLELGGKFIMKADLIPQRGEELLEGVKAMLYILGSAKSILKAHTGTILPHSFGTDVVKWNKLLQAKKYLKSIKDMTFFGEKTIQATRNFERDLIKSGVLVRIGEHKVKGYVDKQLLRVLQYKESFSLNVSEPISKPINEELFKEFYKYNCQTIPNIHTEEDGLPFVAKIENHTDIMQEEIYEMQQFIEKEKQNPFADISVTENKAYFTSIHPNQFLKLSVIRIGRLCLFSTVAMAIIFSRSSVKSAFNKAGFQRALLILVFLYMLDGAVDFMQAWFMPELI